MSKNKVETEMTENILLSFLINGNIIFCNTPQLSLNNLKEYLFEDPVVIITEKNLKITEKDTLLKNKDKIEFISIVGGG